MDELWPWITLALLGAYHGVNPAMGWLFAVALGLQERRRTAVTRAFVPIALGHAASVAAVVALLGAAQTVVSPDALRLAGAGALLLFALVKLLKPGAHPRWVGMRVGFRDLTLWSFLMSTAHGAGLMLVPVLLRLTETAPATVDHADHAAHLAMASGSTPPTVLMELAAVGVHSGAMFLVMGVIALVVYEKVGLAILRRAWFNLDRVWTGALLAAGMVTLVL